MITLDLMSSPCLLSPTKASDRKAQIESRMVKSAWSSERILDALECCDTIIGAMDSSRIDVVRYNNTDAVIFTLNQYIGASFSSALFINSRFAAYAGR